MASVQQYPISEAITMLIEESVTSFTWFFADKEKAVKFRKAAATELGRRSASNEAKLLTTSLISTVHADKVVYFVLILPKTDEGEKDSEPDL